MRPDRRQQVEELYRAARDPEKRARVLSESDPELRREVEALLAAEPDGSTVGMGAPAGIPAGVQIGQYRIESKLGEGGMGAVYRALDTKLNRSVAIKFLSDDLADAAARRRFQREAQMASSLNHPHILTVHDVGEFEGRQYLVTEFVDGGTLKDWAKQGKRTWRQIIELLVGVADGLAAAHSAGITHRDIKPDNILVANNGYAKLSDFGLAKLAQGGEVDHERTVTGGGTRAGAIFGTIPYMSPEQASGQQLDARSDVFSFGVVLHEILAGRRPFTGVTDREVVQAIIHTDPTPLDVEVPSALRNIVEKALEKDPAERFQTMRELVVDLRRLARHKDTETAPIVLKTRRSWLPWAAGVVAIMAAGAGLYYYRMGALSSQPNQNWIIRPVTSLVGIEWGPSWSPDGNFLAYSHSGSGNMDIYVMPTGGGDALRLTTNPADDVEPRWSPDGRYLAFVSDRGAGANVYLIPPLGGAERKLTETRIPAIERFGEMTQSLGATPWSPDGQALLFPRINPGGQSALWKVEPATGKETQMTSPPTGSDDNGGSWSFDGQQIVFDRRQGGRTALWLLPAAGGDPRVLLDDRYSNAHQPSWSSDNKRIIFSSLRGGPQNIWDLDIASQRLRALTSGPGQDQYPVVARNGKLAYSNWNHQTDLYSVELRSRSQQRLTSHTANNFNPRFSPDGKQIVYESNRTGNNEIWLLNLEPRSERQLTRDPGDDRTPDWSPDGREIVFLSNRGGASQVWAMNTEGANLRRVSNQSMQVTSGGAASATSFSAPRWSHDGKAIGYLASSQQGLALWTVDPDGTNARTRLRGALAFDWYRDSSHVVYTRLAADGSGAREMLLTDLDSHQETLLHKGPTVELAAARDGSAIAYCYAVNHVGQELYVLRLAIAGVAGRLPKPMGEPERITHGQGNWHVHGPSWSADGKTVVYTRDADQGDIYVIENYR